MEQALVAERTYQLHTARPDRPAALAAGNPAFGQGNEHDATLTPIRQAAEGLLDPGELNELNRLEIDLFAGHQLTAALRASATNSPH